MFGKNGRLKRMSITKVLLKKGGTAQIKQYFKLEILCTFAG